MSNKLISYEDFDVAVKASYQLGLLEGKKQMQEEMNKLRISANQMLTVNHLLFKSQMKADASVLITFKLARKIVTALYGKEHLVIRAELTKMIRDANNKPKPSPRYIPSEGAEECQVH